MSDRTIMEMQELDLTRIKLKTDFKTEINMKNKEEIDKKNKKDPYENMIFVNKLDNIYMSFKDHPPYFVLLRWLLLLTIILFNTLLLILFQMLSQPKNNVYCFNRNTLEFNICDLESYCANNNDGLINYLFLDDKYYDDDYIVEQRKINDKFKSFFFQEYIIFSKLNYNQISKNSEIMTRFNVIAILSADEKTNFFLIFQQVCNRKEVSLEIDVTLLIGYSVGNIFVMFLADLYGRKKMVVQNCFCSGICSMTIGLFSYFLINYSDFKINSSGFNLPSDLMVNQNLYSEYMNSFNEVQAIIQQSQVISFLFSKYKFIFYMMLFLISINLSSSISVCNAYILENSLNDSDIFYNYNFQNNGFIIAFLLNYVFSKTCKTFYLAFMIIGGLQIILSIFIQILLYESPRHHYEFYEYNLITEFLKNICKEDISKFLVKISDERIKVELIKNQLASQENTLLGTSRVIRERLKKGLIQLNYSEIYRSDIVSNPLMIYSLMIKNKHIRKNIFIIYSLILNIALIYFLFMINLNKSFVVSRKNLSSAINYEIFILSGILFISQNFFLFLLKFFSHNIVLFICFFFIFILSILFEYSNQGIIENNNLNKYTFNSENINFDLNKNYYFLIFCFIAFFSYGLNVTMFMYLTKYTKTIYRCCFYGLCQIVIDNTMFFTSLVNEYFEKSMYFTAIAALVGFVNAFFVYQNFDESIINDYRKLDIDNKRQSKFHNNKTKNE